MTEEEEIKRNMEKLHISREEAEELYISDHEEIDTPEQKEYTAKAKKVRRYEKSDTPRKKTVPNRKIDQKKVEILKSVAHQLTRCVIEAEPKDLYIECINIPKPEKEITFILDGENYSITLTKHRPKGA